MIARSRPENVRVSYISQFTAAAKAATPSSSSSAEVEEGNADEEEEVAAEEKKDVEDSEETVQAKRKVIRDLLSSIKGLRLEGTDKEFEGFANLLLALILSLFPATHPDFPTLILILSDALLFSAERIANPTLSTRYAALAIVFNSLPPTLTNLRLTTLLKLITYAASNDDFPVIAPALERLESWLLEWGFGPGTAGEEEGNAAISTVVSALLAKSKATEARTLLVAHLSSPSAVSGSSSTPSAWAAKLASQLITLSLALPTVYDFSTLSSIPAVASPSTPQLAQLLAIFQQGDVAAFEQFVASHEHQQVLEEHQLDKAQLETKLKLLALAELCSKKVGENVSYDEIAQALRLSGGGKEDDGEEVETWVIDGAFLALRWPFFRPWLPADLLLLLRPAIRASLLSGRLSQSLATLHVTRAAPRSFTTSHWSTLATRLEGWRSSLDAILASVEKGVDVGGAVEIQGARDERELKSEMIAA